jgi:crossover junction endodeoxyribonuclease RusA
LTDSFENGASTNDASVEIEFPFEFIVEGTPVSGQAKSKRSIRLWQQRIVAAFQIALPKAHFLSTVPMAVTLYYFPPTEMQGDIDNIVQPILNAMKTHIYKDDKQVERLVVQKFEPGKLFEFASPSAALADALYRAKPVLYVRLSDKILEGLE